jgi:glycosyltransferase involved in cell wall biosynthesis
MTALRIGIDGTCLGSGRGYGRFLRELLGPLQAARAPHTYVLFVDEETADEVALPDLPTVLLETGESQARAASARGNRSVADLWRMGRGVGRHQLDAFYFPSIYSWFPLPPGLPMAVAIHDTIPERHGAIVFPTRRNRILWNLKSRAARFQARTIITVSEYARRQIHAVMGIPEERIFVTPEAPSPEFGPCQEPALRHTWLRERGLPEDARYFLYVGGFNPHKNVLGLVAAFAQLGPDRDGRLPRLLLVGDHEGDVFHSNVEAIRAEIARRDLESRVTWTGFVPDDALGRLYAGSHALVLPSFEEGFGLPAVEAAACGAPCVATRESPLPEVLEGGGLFFDPGEPEALLRCLTRIWGDDVLRDTLAGQATARASVLSWEITARETRRALEATAGGATR